MKCGITIQERLKDLRTERHLKLGELEKLTGISSSALSSYENNDYKEINHGNLITLAKFYGMSTDYLLCLTENRNHPNTTLSELHLSDEMIDLLKSGRMNNRLLCEIVTHEDFISLITDAEIYVGGIATMRFQDLNNGVGSDTGGGSAPVSAGGRRYSFESVTGFPDIGRCLFLSCDT